VYPWTSRYVLEVSILAQRAFRGAAHMSGAQRENDRDDSKGPAPLRVPLRASLPALTALRSGLALTGLAGVVCLLVATFTTVIQIKVGTTTTVAGATLSHTGWDRHGPALVLLALLGAGLLAVALRGSRAAMAGLAAAGVAAVVIALAWDRPHIHDTGAVGELYDAATAGPAAGYYLETLGGALLLLSGGALLLLLGRAGAETTTAAPKSGRRQEAA
jgi:hypothetical protein